MTRKVDAELTFVVAGAPPQALAIAAERVRSIVPALAFAGRQLDLRSLLPMAPLDDGTHVLVVRGESSDVGLCVSGNLRMLTLAANAVLAVPAVLGEPSGLSHLLAPQGVPLMFVLDLARLDETAHCPWPPRALATET
ncbi:MAG TPA: hypothetical protein VER11_11580 [Polyangiaceae bacterium]|nr:hypothetical protein [Polyangiaceae bacterium]